MKWLSMPQNIIEEGKQTAGEITEIGCMCGKCNCNKKVLLVISICDSCLKGQHKQSQIYN